MEGNVEERMLVEDKEFILPAPRPKKVAIVGFASTWVDAPFNDETWEIWGLNQLYLEIRPFVGRDRWNRWFDLHTREVIEADTHRTKTPIGDYAAMTCPIFMQQHWDDIPMSVPYPIQPVIQQFGDYWTNTISYMMALAIAEGYEEIGLWGVDMSHSTEYGHQRPSCEYMIGIARGRGIKVTVPLKSDLLKAPFLYGYHEPQMSAFFAKMHQQRQQWIDQRAAAEAEIKRQESNVNQCVGAEAAMDYVLRVWGGTIL